MSEASDRKDEIQGEIVHVYDGIEEADNALPKWWLFTFYAAIVFAAGYWLYYHEYEMAPLALEAYQEEMAARAPEIDVTEEMIIALVDDPEALSRGEGHFNTICAQCHKPSGAGDIGPNLTDAYWVHGGSGVDIYRVVNEGILTAGMPAWGGVLGPQGTQDVSAYVLTMRNTNVEDGKEPQGELWEDPNAVAEEPDAGEAQASDGGALAADSDAAAAEVAAIEVAAIEEEAIEEEAIEEEAAEGE